MNTNSEFVKTINNLVRQSFGHFYRGNYSILGGMTDGALVSTDDLEVIATNFTIRDPQFGGGVAGLLGSEKNSNPDGSVIVVIKKFENRARKYAKLYEKIFGKKVQVILVNDFCDLFPTIRLVSGSPVPGSFPSDERFFKDAKITPF